MMSKDTMKNTLEVQKKGIEGRRSALKKIGIAAPAIITLSSRPAYGAGFCSLSGFASVNASGVLRHSNQHCYGLSHGAWKTPFNGDGTWPFGCTPNPPTESFPTQKKLIDGLKVAGNTIIADRVSYGTTSFSSIFTPVSRTPEPSDWPANLPFSLHDAMLYGAHPEREAAAAYLNAKAGIVTFKFTTAEVVSLYNDLAHTLANGQIVSFNTYTDFADFFEAAQH